MFKELCSTRLDAGVRKWFVCLSLREDCVITVVEGGQMLLCYMQVDTSYWSMGSAYVLYAGFRFTNKATLDLMYDTGYRASQDETVFTFVLFQWDRCGRILQGSVHSSSPLSKADARLPKSRTLRALTVARSYNISDSWEIWRTKTLPCRKGMFCLRLNR